MPARQYTLSPLFPEGMVTDVDPNLLKPTQAVLIQDGMWNYTGHLQKRGGLFYMSGANPLNAATDKITSCVAWPSSTYYLVMGDANGRLARMAWSENFASATTSTASSSIQVRSGVPMWPTLVYGNEVIAVSPTSAAAAIRWSGATTGAAAGAGTVSVSQDGYDITGAGSNFLTRFAETGQYIYITDDYGNDWYYLVEKVVSDTVLRVSTPIEMTTDAGLSWGSSPYAYFNISAYVTEKGRGSAAATTVTGTGTTWNSGYTAVLAGDFIGQPNNAIGRWQVASVASDSSLTTVIATGWASNKNATVTRRMFGSVVCEHQNRLWFAGFPEYPNRVHLLPAGASPSVAYNGVDSATAAPLAANVAEYVDVPSPTEPGKVVALVSVREPGGLAVFRDLDFYMVYGEWPSVQVQKISSDVGCLGRRAACEIPGGVAWLGTEGIYVHRPGGGVQNITDGKIRRQWTDIARAVTTSSNRLTAECAMSIAYADEHLFVSVAYTATPTSSSDVANFVYSFRNEAWVKWTGYVPRSFTVVRNPVVNGVDVLAADQSTNRFVSMAAGIGTAGTGSTSALNGTFIARSGYNLIDRDVGQIGRVIDGKITLSQSGTSVVTVVKTGFALDTATTISGNRTTTKFRFRPGSTQMGVGNVAFNEQAFEISESSGTFGQLEIEGISWTVRLRRSRA